MNRFVVKSHFDLPCDEIAGVRLVVALGGGVGVWSVVNLMEGYGADNPASKSQGVKQLMAGGGIMLLGLKVVPLLSSLITV